MSFKFYLPTYEECCEIVASNEKAFYETKHEIDGFQVSVFNYRIADLNNFINPVPGKDILATELRGISFIKTEAGWQRRIMLHKFFNVNQVEGYLFEQLSSHKIERVSDKADGSMIVFLELPNGKIIPKTKMGFGNSQVELAQKVYDQSPELKKFIKETIDNGLVAIFELVSPQNAVVLRYNQTKLLLLQLREENTGKYLNIYKNEIVSKYNIDLVKVENTALTLKEYLELAKTKEGIEGWVITFSNGQMAKVKTAHYCSIHGLVTDSMTRENLLMKIIIDEKIDDALALIGKDDVRRIYAAGVQAIVAKYLAETEIATQSIIDDFGGDRKAWHQKHGKSPYFSLAAACVGKSNLEEGHIFKVIKDNLSKNTYRLMDAKQWLSERGFKIQDITSSLGDLN